MAGSTFGEVVTRFTADVSGFTSGLASMASATADWGGKVVGMAGNVVSGFLSIPGSIVGAIGKMSEWVFFVDEAIGRIGELADKLFSSASSWEQWGVQLTAFTGSGQAASAMLQRLYDFAIKTPFEVSGIVRAGEKLLAMGTAAKDVVPTLDAVAGAVYATGGDTSGIEAVITALDRMRETGKLTDISLRTLISQGIPVWDILAKKLNTDVVGAHLAVKNGALDTNTAIRYLLEGMKQMGDPALSKFGDTWKGALSNIKVAAEDAWRQFSTPIMNQIKGGVNEIATALGSKEFREFAGTVGVGAARVLGDIGTGFSHLLTWLSPVTSGIGQFVDKLKDPQVAAAASGAWSTMSAAFQTIGNFLAPLPRLLGNFFSNLDEKKLFNFAQNLAAGLNNQLQHLTGLLTTLGNAAVTVGKQMDANPDWQKFSSGAMTSVGSLGHLVTSLEDLAGHFTNAATKGTLVSSVLIDIAKQAAAPALALLGLTEAVAQLADALDKIPKPVAGFPGVYNIVITASKNMVTQVEGHASGLRDFWTSQLQHMRDDAKAVFASMGTDIPKDVAAMTDSVLRENARLKNDTVGQWQAMRDAVTQTEAYILAGANSWAAKMIISNYNQWSHMAADAKGQIQSMIDAMNHLNNTSAKPTVAVQGIGPSLHDIDMMRQRLIDLNGRRADTYVNNWVTTTYQTVAVSGVRGYQHGGIISEPIVGVGLRSGRGYTFGEAGPETVTPGAGKGHGGIPDRLVLNVHFDSRQVAQAMAPEIGEIIRLELGGAR